MIPFIVDLFVPGLSWLLCVPVISYFYLIERYDRKLSLDDASVDIPSLNFLEQELEKIERMIDQY